MHGRKGMHYFFNKKYKAMSTQLKGLEPSKIKRYPRPYGLTLMARNLQKTKERKGTKSETYQNQKKKLREYIIDEYIRNQFYINGTYLSIQKLAQLIKLSIDETQTYLNERIVQRAALMGDEVIKGTSRVMAFGLIKKGTEIQAYNEAQVQLLLKAQGGKYKAFISSTTNQAIKNLTDSQKSILDALKHITDKMPNLWNSPSGENPGNPTTYLSPESAVDLILKNGFTLMTNKEALELKAQELKGLPEVDARFQNLTNIGIRHDGTKNGMIDITPKADSGMPKGVPINDEGQMNKKVHEMRRREGMEILDADEFIG